MCSTYIGWPDDKSRIDTGCCKTRFLVTIGTGKPSQTADGNGTISPNRCWYVPVARMGPKRNPNYPSCLSQSMISPQMRHRLDTGIIQVDTFGLSQARQNKPCQERQFRPGALFCQSQLQTDILLQRSKPYADLSLP